MARTSSLEAVAERSGLLGTSKRLRRSLLRRQSSGTKEPITSSSLSHDRCSTRTAGEWMSSGRGRWSFASMPGRRLLLAPAEDVSQLRRRNRAAALRFGAGAILWEEDDSKQLSKDEGGEEGALVTVRTRTRYQTVAEGTLCDGTVTSTRSSSATRPATRRSRPEMRPGSDTLCSSRSTTTRT